MPLASPFTIRVSHPFALSHPLPSSRPPPHLPGPFGDAELFDVEANLLPSTIYFPVTEAREAREARERELSISISFQPFDSDNSMYRYALFVRGNSRCLLHQHANERANDEMQ